MQSIRFSKFNALCSAALGAAAVLAAAAPALGTTFAQPYISSFTPASGPPGTVITVYGSGFTGLDVAWIGKGQDGTVRVLSDSVVEVTVPADASTAHPGILNPQKAAFAPNNFTVTAVATKTVATPVPPTTASGGDPNVSGSVAGPAGVTISLGGAATKTTTTNASLSYTFTGLSDGTYSLAPSHAGYWFSPASWVRTLSGTTSASGVNFSSTATAVPTYSISGNIGGSILGGVIVTLNGTNIGATVTEAGGSYSFSGLTSGIYTVSASRPGYSFTTKVASITLGNTNSVANDFTAVATPSDSNVQVVTVNPMPPATVGVAYAATTVKSATGGNGSYTFHTGTMLDGTLPQGDGTPPRGMYVTPDGVLHGTAKYAGKYYFTVCATDTAGDTTAACEGTWLNVAGAKTTASPTSPPPVTTPPVTTPPVTTPSTALKISVSGNHLIDGNGNTVQLRGVNVSGLESVAVSGWDAANPWGGQTGDATPNWSVIKTWKTNAVRLPLNEASWLGYSCVDAAGATRDPDPGHNYQATVAESVAGATAAGLYVILDLHWTAPGNACPMGQNPMADADHSVAFWTSLASTFKGYPNVIFELFNEPFLDQSSLEDDAPWADLLNGGGTFSSYVTGGNPGVIDYTWKNAGMQQMLDAVRATGATNVVLTSTVAWSSAMGGWLQYKPTDPAKQLGAVWHAYSAAAYGYPDQVSCWGLPACSATIMADVQGILAAGYPVVVTEFGDAITAGAGNTAPWASVLLPFADANGLSYLGWTWDVWTGFSANVLITDEQGDPTNGFGTYVKQHYLCAGAGTANCK
jgi:aryl-phospho-beta-D-glucosidase BglC (GH1 family)